MMSTKEWWESLPLIEKANIVDYKFSDYAWDSLNEVDRALIKNIQKSEESKDE